MRTDFLFGIAGALSLIAALRDSFAPGFLQVSSHHASTGEALMNFALACFYFILAAHVRRKQKSA